MLIRKTLITSVFHQHYLLAGITCNARNKRIMDQTYRIWDSIYLWANPKAIAVISFFGKPASKLSICDRIHRISSCTAVFDRQDRFNLSLMAFPSFASATSNCSCRSFATTFFSIFFSDFDILPSTAAVVAANASVVSVNFSKCFNLTL